MFTFVYFEGWHSFITLQCQYAALSLDQPCHVLLEPDWYLVVLAFPATWWCPGLIPDSMVVLGIETRVGPSEGSA